MHGTCDEFVAKVQEKYPGVHRMKLCAYRKVPLVYSRASDSMRSLHIDTDGAEFSFDMEIRPETMKLEFALCLFINAISCSEINTLSLHLSPFLSTPGNIDWTYIHTHLPTTICHTLTLPLMS